LRSQTLTVAVLAPVMAVAISCGGGKAESPTQPAPTPTPLPTPTPTPTPTASAACQLKAPTVDCATRSVYPQELAPALQAALDTAFTTPGVMYTEYANRIYDLTRFRAIVVDHLTAAKLCGAWDYGNGTGDEIYVRSADGCVIEQYDILSSDGGVRPAGKGSNAWQDGWGLPVPAPRPQYSRDGDLTCSLEGDRATFCFTIKNTPGYFGTDAYRMIAEVMQENPALFDPKDTLGGGGFDPEIGRLPSWRILNQDAYLAAVIKKLKAGGYCAYVDKGDILRVKSVARGNVLHEEFDIVQNPTSGGAYTMFVVKDRCHNAGF
jgi:hypothetical protein